MEQQVACANAVDQIRFRRVALEAATHAGAVANELAIGQYINRIQQEYGFFHVFLFFSYRRSHTPIYQNEADHISGPFLVACVADRIVTPVSINRLLKLTAVVRVPSAKGSRDL